MKSYEDNGSSRDAIEHVARCADQALSRVLPSVLPVITPTKTGEPDFVGSAVLMQIGAMSFLVTAAHVMDRVQNELFVVGENETAIALAGSFNSTIAPNGDREADRIDLCVMPLSDRQIGDLSHSRFLTLADLEPKETLDLRPVVGGKYLLVGYPSTAQRIASDGAVEFTPLRFAANASPPGSYERGGWSTSDHIVVEYDKKTSWNTAGKTTPPDPYGVIGGGIFRARGWLDGGAVSETLVGIPICYTGKQGKSVVGTRIGWVLRHVAHEHPSLCQTIVRHFT